MVKLQTQYLDREDVIAVLVRILRKRRKREEEERLREGERVNRWREERTK
jgi:transposase InsO family protein